MTLTDSDNTGGIKAIVSGVTNNHQLMVGIVEQLKKVLQPAPPTTATGSSIPLDIVQQPGNQPALAGSTSANTRFVT